MKLQYTWLFLLLATPGCGLKPATTSETLSRKDAASILILPDGRYDVLCKNGSRQIISESDFLADKVCERPPILCGDYEAEQELKGTYIVSCDVRFLAPVHILPGTKLLADDMWAMEFQGIEARGTPEQPIEFGFSPNSRTQQWAAFSFAAKAGEALDFDPLTGFRQGSILESVRFEELEGSFQLDQIYARNIEVKSSREFKFSGYLGQSTLAFETLSVNSGFTNMSYFLSNKVLLKGVHEYWKYLEGQNAFLAWNHWRAEGEARISPRISGALYYYNTFDIPVATDEFCGSFANTTVYANNFLQTDSIPCKKQKYNTFGAESTTPSLELIATKDLQRSYKKQAGEAVTIDFLVLGRGGFLEDRQIATKATYTIDGADYEAPDTFKGPSPMIVIFEKESYDIVPSILNAKDPVVLGFDRIRLDVR